MIYLGSKVKDLITGFEGIATTRTLHLHGCVHIGVTPAELQNGKPLESQVFDEQRLRVLEAADNHPDLPLALVGGRAVDRITGFGGLVTSAVSYYLGPVCVAVTAEYTHEGKPVEPQWFDVGRVNILSRPEIQVSPDSSATSGGPGHLPARINR